MKRAAVTVHVVLIDSLHVIFASVHLMQRMADRGSA